MIRDPFDIHRKNLFQLTARRAAENIRDTAAQIGTNALKMPFSIPKNVPNFEDPHRRLEDKAWSKVSGRGGGGGLLSDVQQRVNGMFESDELPMYKDKPYYHDRGRHRRWYRKKRAVGSLALVLVILFHILGWLPWQSSRPKAARGKSAWGFMGISKNEVVNWDHRRAQVVEAFELSWDAYERYAWGMAAIVRRVKRVLTNDSWKQATMNSTQSRSPENTWLPRAWAGSSSTRSTQ